MKWLAMAAVLGVATIGGAAQAAMPAGAFVAKAGASDRFEIESARLMLGSHNPAVRGFAQRMIADHHESTRLILAAAHADHLWPKPPELSVGQRADLTALKAVPAGKTKDDLYIKQQRAAHADAAALMTAYASSGGAPHLRMTAGKIEPVVQQHEAMLAHI